MKFIVTMKDPDAVYESIKQAVEEDEELGWLTAKLSKPEAEQVIKIRKEEMRKVLKKWFEYDEYVRIKIDMQNGTATVLDRL